MSSSFNDIEILSVIGTTVTFRATLIDTFNVDDFFVKPSFALMVLHEAVHDRGEGGPLAEALDPDQLSEDRFMKKHSVDYVKSVTVSEKKHHPPVEGGPAPQALYTVELTDAKWGVGVKVGLRFETTAYDV